MATQTGFPTVLGWDQHERLWRGRGDRGRDRRPAAGRRRHLHRRHPGAGPAVTGQVRRHLRRGRLPGAAEVRGERWPGQVRRRRPRSPSSVQGQTRRSTRLSAGRQRHRLGHELPRRQRASLPAAAGGRPPPGAPDHDRPAHLQRGGEPPPDGGGPARPRSRRSTSWWWTTTPRTGRASSPTAWPRPTPGGWPCCTARSKTGLGDAYLAGFRRALAGGAERIFEMDADFSHPVAAVPAMLDLAETLRRRRRLALRPGGQPRPALEPPAPLRLLGRQRLRPPGHRPDGARHHRRLQVLPARGAGAHRPGRRALPGLQLPDRDGPALPARRAAGGGVSHPLPGAGRRGVQDDPRDRPRGAVAPAGSCATRADRVRTRRGTRRGRSPQDASPRPMERSVASPTV